MVDQKIPTDTHKEALSQIYYIEKGVLKKPYQQQRPLFLGDNTQGYIFFELV